MSDVSKEEDFFLKLTSDIRHPTSIFLWMINISKVIVI